MKFSQDVTLIGVVGKKGSGTLDNGDAWSTDRAELHVLSQFDEADAMAHGQTVNVYQIQDYAANYEAAKLLIDQRITIDFEMVAAKKLGQAPKMVARAFRAANSAKKAS